METAPLFERDRRPRARFVLPFALLAACALGAATLRGSERRAVVGELASEHHHHHSSHKGDDDDASSSSSSSSAAEGEGGSDDRMASTADVVKSANASRPHIIISLIDDQGFADMGYANEFDLLGDCTPYMDSLAADGIKLEWYYSQQLCTPSRASLLTGYYPIHLGMQHDVIQPESVFGMPLGHKLLPSFLKEFYGYTTHIVGKVRARATRRDATRRALLLPRGRDGVPCRVTRPLGLASRSGTSATTRRITCRNTAASTTSTATSRISCGITTTNRRTRAWARRASTI